MIFAGSYGSILQPLADAVVTVSSTLNGTACGRRLGPGVKQQVTAVTTIDKTVFG